jgi:hypothetical protein
MPTKTICEKDMRRRPLPFLLLIAKTPPRPNGSTKRALGINQTVLILVEQSLIEGDGDANRFTSDF